jgi:carbon-monoxide dehydrogenase large subunit
MMGARGGFYESAQVRVAPDGSVTAYLGTHNHGQGHETAFAQLVGGVLAIAHTDVRVVHSDTALVERGQGSWGSRSLQAGGSVLFARAGEVVDRARALAAAALEADPVDLEGPVDGRFRVLGAPERSIGWRELAARLRRRRCPPGWRADPRRHVRSAPHRRRRRGCRDRGRPPDPPVAVDDCGHASSPMLVQASSTAASRKGSAQALFEGGSAR